MDSGLIFGPAILCSYMQVNLSLPWLKIGRLEIILIQLTQSRVMASGCWGQGMPEDRKVTFRSVQRLFLLRSLYVR